MLIFDPMSATPRTSVVGADRLTENSEQLLRMVSMHKFKPENRVQSFLLPPSVEEFIGENHLARVIDEVVNTLDTSSIEQYYSYLGQKSYHPKTLLKLLFYGYSVGIRSGRKIAASCECDVAFMFLSCMYRPDFRTINDFRKNNVAAIEGLFVQVVQLCAAMHMVNVGTLVIDATKIRANASSRMSKTKEQYAEWLSQMQNKIKTVLKEAEATDNEEDEKYSDKRGDELPTDINTREKLRNKVKEAMERLKEGEKLNLTDNDAKIINSKNQLKTNYNCQAACTTNGIIVSAYATNSASDKEHLMPLIRQAESNTSQQSNIIMADSGYASYQNYEQLDYLNKTILVPDQEKESEKTKAATDPYHRNHFQYNQANDMFTCPEGKNLIYTRTYIHTKNKQRGKTYQGTECKSCLKKPLCTHGTARQIQVDNRTPLRTKVRELLDSSWGRQIYRLRQQIIEPIFGNLKHNYKYTIMHLRTLPKVNAEWQMMCLTHNIKQIWKMKLNSPR